MGYLVILNQEHRAHVVQDKEDLHRMCLTHLDPDVVEEWTLRASVGDHLCDGRFARIEVVKLGETTDASAVLARKEASRELENATQATARAVRLLDGTEAP